MLFGLLDSPGGCYHRGICRWTGPLAGLWIDALANLGLAAAVLSVAFVRLPRRRQLLLNVVLSAATFTVYAAIGTYILYPARTRCKIYEQVAFLSDCQSGAWLDAAAPLLASDRMVLFNLGANTGFTISSFLQRFQHGWKHSNRHWHHALQAQQPDVSGGVCDDAEAATSPSAAVPGARVHVVAVELARKNAVLLRHVFGRLHVHGRVYHAAASDAVGTAHEPGGAHRGGFESAAISDAGPVVKMTTADALSAKLNVSRIDLLSIDTEGWDSKVIRGASSLLRRRAVRVLEFEFGTGGAQGHWGPRTLHDTLQFLQSLGYSCFWEGDRGHLAPATPECNEHAPLKWSNIVCAHEPAVVEVMRSFTPLRRLD